MTDTTPTQPPFSVHVCRDDDLLGIEARLLERAVFLETFGNTPALMQQEYGPYADHSVYLVVVDNVAEQVAGMMRVIGDGGGRLKSLSDIEHEPWSRPLDEVLPASGLGSLDLSTTLDIATLAVHPDYRGAATSGLVSLALYQAVCQVAVAAGMEHFVAILDCVVLDSIQTRTAAPFDFYRGVGPARYLDSPASVPVICNIGAYRRRLARDERELHDLLFEAIGFESVIEPIDRRQGGQLVAAATSQSERLTSTVIDLRTGVSPLEPAGTV